MRTSPTAIKRWIALESRRLREAAGVDRATAAERIGKASTVIAHIETARNLPAPADVEVLLNLYGVPDRVPFFRDMIKRARRGQDWWRGFSDAMPGWFELYLGLEAAAARLSFYHSWVPGLLQTREYAEETYRCGEPRQTDAEIATKVELRMARQAILERDEDRPQIRCVFDENVLRRKVGGPDVMRGQLERLLKLADRPNIEIQILADESGAHAALEGAFTILDYPPEFSGDPGTVYAETRQQGLYYEEPQQVADFRRVFERLQTQAEKPGRSAELIRNTAKEL